MPICKTIKTTRTKICTGDMTARIDLLLREILPPAIGDVNPITVFTSILQPFAAVKSISLSSGSPRRFD